MPVELAKVKIELARLYKNIMLPDDKISKQINIRNADNRKIMSHFLIFDHKSKNNLTIYLSVYHE